MKGNLAYNVVIIMWLKDCRAHLYLWLFAAVATGLFAVSLPVYAQTSDTLSPARRAELIQQINLLQAEIAKLQHILAIVRANPGVVSVKLIQRPYETEYYSGETETIYDVSEGTLRPVADHQVRPVDEALYEMLQGTLGERAVAQYIKEFRVFNDPERDIGAFVEVKRGTDDWIMGVNRDTYSSYSQKYADQVEDIYEQLFVHEYAHILAYYNPGLSEAFEELWSRGDYRHSEQAEALSDSGWFDVLSSYYEDNEERFVSDYATVHPDEDMAETFVEYVRADRMSQSDVLRARKVWLFQGYDDFVKAREEIRNNVGW